MAKIDIYQAVTDRILETLDKGTVPWRHPIKRSADHDGLPRSMNSKKPYRGVNIFLLAMTAWAKGYESAYWLTYKQAKAQGGQVRKGEKASLVIFWKRYATTDKETGDKKVVPVMRHYNVFNAEQVEGIEVTDAVPPDPDAEPFKPIDEAENIVTGYAGGPVIEHGGGQAYYRPGEDLVRIPGAERFADPESYYATLFHELAHSTGHSKRLNRGLDQKLAPFGSADYSKEELVAEMGAAFLAAAAGISPPTIEQSAAYIDGWRRKLKGDKKLIVQAAGSGQRAADHVLGVSWDEPANDEGAEP